ncbi:MAG: cupin domain-containing protein [Gammaproteobacteria bacterium]|nr:cupin domain-containing protein [Gammaproteobacteria bacterium]
MTKTSTPNPLLRPISIRPESGTATRQGLPYFVGISAETAGAQGLSMSLVVVPPGAVSEPHVHEGYETAIYVLSGRVETRYGRLLEHSVINGPGDFLFVPPGLPHQAINLSADEPARAIVARNDPNEREKVSLYPLPEDE